MRLALLLRQQRQFLMQYTSHSEATPPPPSALQPSNLKRSYSQSATAAASPSIARSGLHDAPFIPSWSTSSMSQRPIKIPKLSRLSSSAATALASARPSGQIDVSMATPAAATSSMAASSSTSKRQQGHANPAPIRGKVAASPPGKSRRGRKGRSSGQPKLPMLDSPIHDEAYITAQYKNDDPQLPPIKQGHGKASKATLLNFYITASGGEKPQYDVAHGWVTDGGKIQELHRSIVTLPHMDIVGTGDAPDRKTSERLAYLSAMYQVHARGILYEPKKVAPRGAPSITSHTTVPLSDGTEISYEKARAFMDYYCRRYKFRQDITYEEVPQRGANSTWEAMMLVDDRRIGIGSGTNKKSAQIASYLDVAQYLEKCDPELWQTFVEVAKTGGDLGLAPRVHFRVGAELEEEIRDLCYHIKRSVLYKNRPALSQPKPDSADSPDHDVSAATVSGPWRYQRTPRPQALKAKSEMLLKRQKAYLTDPTQETMRQTRMSLPVYSRSEDVLKAINSNEVTILLAATGSGKTTQVPQLILDEYIARGEGALCNIVCTQPRRIAALSVANRVARERGESVGSTVGYQVRFESRSPEDHGSITFCTTGVFLKRMQSVLQKNGGIGSMDHVTHVIVDEVHERDIDTDLLLVVLKRLLADRKARNLPIKVVLMSATIDPSLFQHYFPDAQGHPAPAIEVPGRAFPVEKHFLEDYLPHLRTAPGAAWVFAQSQVIPYLQNEVSMESLTSLGLRLNTEQSAQRDEDFELPSALIALVISHVLRSSTDGHVLVFLPGWEEMIAVVKCLEDETGPFHAVFSDPEKYKVHLLHSSIPLADQQVIFDPPPEGVRRIILATNIAETSLTIPDIVYVVDTAKVKEIRYDPDRHMSSLVSAWTGSSNLNQRAGRAGRHRPGQYYGVLGKNRVAGLQAYQTVEMKRADLSNVVMHVKALDFPGMTVEEVLESAIEPPTNERVVAAIRNLQMAGALDGQNNVTPLGRVLLQLPIDAQMGRLVLFGSFFRCLDNALTLAAILTNRDPFLAPLHLRDQAAARKNSFTSSEFRSDVLAILQAYISWSAKQEARQFAAANRFCIDNFLSKPTLITIQKIRGHILQSLYHSGVIAVSAGGNVGSLGSGRNLRVPPELNANEKSTPLLAALIAIGSQPKFAVRASERVYRTAQDKVTFIHPSSVNSRKRESPGAKQADLHEKQLYAFAEKRQNVSVANSNPVTHLITTTKLDPMTYMIFGAYQIAVVERGVECDGWLPVVGPGDALDDIQRLKTLMEACMSRVFEGITMAQRYHQPLPSMPREESEFGDDEDELKADLSLSAREISDLDLMTRDLVRILNHYHQERIVSQSRQTSRSATPTDSPWSSSSRLPAEASSSRSTPFSSRPSNLDSRPSTPSQLSKRIF